MLRTLSLPDNSSTVIWVSGENGRVITLSRPSASRVASMLRSI